MSKLWQKGTSESQSELAKKVEAFTVGEDYRLDQALVPFDIKASKVHARALQRAGILTEEELMSLLDGLSEIRTLWQAGNFEIDRKSTRLNSSHVAISYAVFCLKKKRITHTTST